ncbi:hypothetical protein [Lutibacter sp. Hel_I_33_5]|uniref:hypothetical protein n=1 Tax=Lutibacter sp. Hel_I_33_5 TaxID=1566289 RepID=UPI0011A8110E|nr:hypothetical protein [Lutibacter sp. Hel_I_33_5]
MVKYLSILFLCCFSIVNAQQKTHKTISSDAPFIEIHTKGVDLLKIETSKTNNIELILTDDDNIGVIENISCNDYNCVLKIETQLKIVNATTDKMNQFSLPPPSNVSITIKIPKDKKVTVFGGLLDVEENNYNGILRLLIDKGIVRIKKNHGITEIDLLSGAVFANTKNTDLHIKSRKGTIIKNGEKVKSPLKEKVKKGAKLIVKSVYVNVELITEETQ